MADFLGGVFGILLLIALFVAVAVVSTLVTMWAWNLVIAGLFHGPVIDFWQALAVGILISLVRGATSRRD